MHNTRKNTPKHCWECWKFKDCKQAQNMTADTETEPGFVISELADGTYIGDYFCSQCLPDEWQDDATPIDFEETDSPCHCCECGVPLIHSITSDGIKYVKEEIKNGTGCCQELWPIIWADYLKE